MSSGPGDDRQQQSTPPIPVHVAASQLVASTESVQFSAGVGPPPLLQLYHVPSAPSSSVAVVDDFSSSASGSSTYGDTSYSAGGVSGLGPLGVPVPTPTRRMREFIPESKKDDEYWTKRQKNNEAAKRSREKRRANDVVMMRRIHELASENKRLKLELDVLRRQLGIVPPPHTDSQPQSARSAAAAAVEPGAGLVQPRPKLEPVSSVTEYSDVPRDVLLGRSVGGVGVLDQAVGGEQQQARLNEAHHLHHHHHHHHPVYQDVRPSTDWPCATDVSLSTSSAGVTAYRRSISGNSLVESAVRRDAAPVASDDGGQTAAAAAAWMSYRGAERTCQPRPSMQPERLVDSTPIVIFSDVSSSGDDSIDETLQSRHVDTLTMRPSVMRVDNGGSADVESPLNLSTPSRQQSPVTLRHAYSVDMDVARRRSSVDFTQEAGGPWYPVTSGSESVTEPLSGERSQHGDAMLMDAAVTQRRSTYSRDWLHDDVHRDLSSRSTSLSSVASVPWHGGGPDTVAPVAAAVTVPRQSVDELPPLHAQSTAAVSDQPAPSASRLAGCGLPLKVRRKLASTSASWGSVEDTPPPVNDSGTAAGGGGFISTTSRRLSDDLGPRRSSSGSQPPVSPADWFAVTSRPVEMSEYELLGADNNGRSQ